MREAVRRLYANSNRLCKGHRKPLLGTSRVRGSRGEKKKWTTREIYSECAIGLSQRDRCITSTSVARNFVTISERRVLECIINILYLPIRFFDTRRPLCSRRETYKVNICERVFIYIVNLYMLTIYKSATFS